MCLQCKLQPADKVRFSSVEAQTIATNALAQLEDDRISSKNPDKCNHDDANNLVYFAAPKYLVIDLAPRVPLLENEEEMFVIIPNA